MTWINIKDQMPPLNEFVEVIIPTKTSWNKTQREFMALIKNNKEYEWHSDYSSEMDYCDKGFGIKYWKPMSPDKNGKKPFIKIKFHKAGFYTFRVYLKKVKS